MEKTFEMEMEELIEEYLVEEDVDCDIWTHSDSTEIELYDVLPDLDRYIGCTVLEGPYKGYVFSAGEPIVTGNTVVGVEIVISDPSMKEVYRGKMDFDSRYFIDFGPYEIVF